MSRNTANRLRMFADVVSIDAWHEAFTNDRHVVDLHADVVFTEGRLGGEKESLVRFRLKLRRAELLLIVPAAEPIEVERASIARFGPRIKGERQHTDAKKVKGSVSAGGKTSASLKSLEVDAHFEAEANIEREREEKCSTTEDICAIEITYRRDNAEQADSWRFMPGMGSTLEGRPWEPGDTPLAKLKDTRQVKDSRIPPTVRLEVRCLREDMEITDIELKAQSSINIFGRDNRLKAAEAYILQKLSEMGLETVELSEPFAKVLLGRVFVTNGRVEG